VSGQRTPGTAALRQREEIAERDQYDWAAERRASDASCSSPHPRGKPSSSSLQSHRGSRAGGAASLRSRRQRVRIGGGSKPPSVLRSSASIRRPSCAKRRSGNRLSRPSINSESSARQRSRPRHEAVHVVDRVRIDHDHLAVGNGLLRLIQGPGDGSRFSVKRRLESYSARQDEQPVHHVWQLRSAVCRIRRPRSARRRRVTSLAR